MVSSILIVTSATDIHIRAVRWCLSQLGHATEVLELGRLGTTFTGAFNISADQEHVYLPHIEAQIPLCGFDTVWFRKFPKVVLPNGVHPDDSGIVVEEMQHFLVPLLKQIAPQAVQVNSTNALFNAEYAINQLTAAKSVGLRFPRTVIGNDPEAIRGLFDQCNQQVIYKPLRAATWANRGKVSFTSKMSSQDIQDTDTLSLCPGVYQELVKKKYEVRALFLGKTCLASRSHTYKHKELELDSKLATPLGLPLKMEPYVLPESIQQKCISLMRELGLVTGVFDILIDENGEFIFLEVNQSGTFLWVEHKCPELPLLQVFSEFLAKPSSDFVWDGSTNQSLTYSGFVAAMERAGINPENGMPEKAYLPSQA